MRTEDHPSSGLVFTFVLGLVLGVVGTTLVGDAREPRVVVESVGGTALAPGSAGTVAPDQPGATAEPGEAAVAPGGGPATSGTTPGNAATTGGTGGGGSATTGAEQGTTSSGTGTTTTGGSDGSATPTDNGGGTARGVTADTIKIGIAVPDLGALRALGPEYDNGDPAEQWRAMQDHWKRSGATPIDGREIELVFDDYDVLDASAQNATCKALVQDARVFVVVAIAYYRVGSECVARDQNTPLLTTDGPSDGQLARSHPNLFSLGMSNNRMVRNMLHFAADSGLLAGKTVGVYHFNDEENHALKEDVLDTLEQLGVPRGQVTVHSTDQDLGGPQDAVAVQRFRTNGVELAVLLTSKPGFMRQADAQEYYPTYIESDHAFGTSDTAAKNYPPSQFDQTVGITGRRVGEVKAGMALDAKQEACLANFERVTGRRPAAETAEWSYILMNCDLAEVLLTTLRNGGPRLTHAGYVAAQQVISMDPVRYGRIAFAPDRHHGTVEFRQVRWHADCTCWKAEGNWRPLYAP